MWSPITTLYFVCLDYLNNLLGWWFTIFTKLFCSPNRCCIAVDRWYSPRSLLLTSFSNKCCSFPTMMVTTDFPWGANSFHYFDGPKPSRLSFPFFAFLQFLLLIRCNLIELDLASLHFPFSAQWHFYGSLRETFLPFAFNQYGVLTISMFVGRINVARLLKLVVSLPFLSFFFTASSSLFFLFLPDEISSSLLDSGRLSYRFPEAWSQFHSRTCIECLL